MKWEQVTSMECLGGRLTSCRGAQVIFKEHVVVAAMNCRGAYEVAVYEFVETPKEIGLLGIECRLNRIAVAETSFADSGSAIQWGFSQL